MKREDTKTILAYIVVCIIWGSTYLAIRIGVQGFPPFLFAGIRFLIASSLMLLYARIKKLEAPKSKGEIARISAVGLFLLLGGNGCVVYAEQWVHSGITALILAASPLFMAVIEVFGYKKNKLSITGWLGLIIGFLGVAWLVISDDMTGAIDVLGCVILLIASFSWAMGSVFSTTFKKNCSIIYQIAIEMLAGGIGLTLVGIIKGEYTRVNMNLQSMGAILYLIIFGSIIAYSSYVYLLQKWPAAKAGTYAYVNPVIAVLLGALILSESLTITVIFSTITILLGVFVVQKSKIAK